MRDFPADEEWDRYYDLVSKYLDQIESHLNNYGIDASDI